MKKMLLLPPVLIVFFCASSSFASTYECYRYVKGQPTGTWIKVKADSKSEAERKAYKQFKELGGRVDSANCR